MSKIKKSDNLNNNTNKKSNFKVGLTTLLIILFILILGKRLIDQESKYSYYKVEYNRLVTKNLELENQKKNLENKKKMVNSNKYIENVARDKCNMYLPNERVYIDVRK